MSPASAKSVPQSDTTVHIVLDDFGKSGRAYRETDAADAGFDTVVDDLMTGQFNNPVRVIAFNAAEGWSRDVSEDVAREVLKRADTGQPLAHAACKFVEKYVDEDGASAA